MLATHSELILEPKEPEGLCREGLGLLPSFKKDPTSCWAWPCGDDVTLAWSRGHKLELGNRIEPSGAGLLHISGLCCVSCNFMILILIFFLFSLRKF